MLTEREDGSDCSSEITLSYWKSVPEYKVNEIFNVDDKTSITILTASFLTD